MLFQACHEPKPSSDLVIHDKRCKTQDEALRNSIRTLSALLKSHTNDCIMVVLGASDENSNPYQGVSYRRNLRTLFYAHDHYSGYNVRWTNTTQESIHEIAKTNGSFSAFGHPAERHEGDGFYIEELLQMTLPRD